MADRILMPPEEARAASSDLNNQTDTADDAFTAMKNRIDGLDGQIEGAFWTAFKSQFDELYPSVQQMLDASRGQADWIRGAADAIESADQQAAGA